MQRLVQYRQVSSVILSRRDFTRCGTKAHPKSPRNTREEPITERASPPLCKRWLCTSHRFMLDVLCIFLTNGNFGLFVQSLARACFALCVVTVVVL